MMENYEYLYKAVCRICLSYEYSENMVSLTDNTAKNGLSCYGKAVLIFTNICIKNDSLPDKMCAKCLFILKQAIIFRKRCESSNEKLKAFERKFDTSSSDFKEKLCDYVLFLENFPNYTSPLHSPQPYSLSKTSENLPLKRKYKVTKATMKKRLKTESHSETDDEGAFLEDISSNEIKEEILGPKHDDNIDSLLTKMEKVAELRPRELQMYRKRYPRVKKQLNSEKNKDIRTFHSDERHRKKKVSQKTEKEKQCKICLKVMANTFSMQAHMERHTGGNYICEQCGRKFCTLAELRYHLASSHDIGAQFICKECGFKAPKRYELKEHERIHTGERPYACDKCGLTFRRRYIWKKHAIYHMEKTIQCQQCPRKFYRKGELVAHINGVHERMYVYACNHCDATYAKTGTVRRHMAEKHGIAKEMQGKVKRIILGKTSNVWNTARGRPSFRTRQPALLEGPSVQAV